MKIAIFGGSFDPIHNEHIEIAKQAVKQFDLDKLLIMPAFCPPHKKKKLSNNADRLQMCRLAFAGEEKIQVSDYEIEKGGTSYTYLTCQHFKNLYPNAQLYWMIGTDMLRDFPTWKNPNQILDMVTLLVCARAEQEDWLNKEQLIFKQLFATMFAYLNYNTKGISSTKIRVLAGGEQDISSYTCPPVATYINEKGLYVIPGAKKSLALQNPSRKAHSLRVAEIASKKAIQLQIPERQAIEGALFHDCAKNLGLDHSLLEGFMPPKDYGVIPPPVMHQFSGEYVAKQLGVKDKAVLSAIRYHTTGRANMSTLEKLIFLADMLEEGRNYTGVDELREEFWAGDIDKCMYLALQNTAGHVASLGGKVYPLSLIALEYYKNVLKKGENYAKHSQQ